MEKVYSRWPSDAGPSATSSEDALPPDIPEWILSSSVDTFSGRQERLILATAATVVVAGIACIAAFGRGDAPRLTALILLLAGAAMAVAWGTVQSQRRAACSARNHAIFERAGIAMWLEDWSAAGERVAELRRSGVRDIEAYYATRPDELRALRSKVIIKDVNAFAVEEAGAPCKGALLGSLDLLLPDTDQTFVQWLVAFGNGDRFFRSEAHVVRPDGTQGDSLFTAALPRNLKGFADIIVTSLDITGYKREQAKLLSADVQVARASRTAAVGALSASIAHEVNSPLAAIVANTQAALRWLRRSDPEVGEAVEAVNAVLADATRARDIIVRTRALVSNAPISSRPFDLVAAAREANLLVERELRECGAGVYLRAEPGLPPAMGDVVQVQQVFTNLLLNAAQAMADRSGAKEITITLARHDNGIRVDVVDTGPGIESSQLERIFDPFHTTRMGGIGMGLAICRECIDAQGGNIWATSIRQGGAALHFTLPAADA